MDQNKYNTNNSFSSRFSGKRSGGKKFAKPNFVRHGQVQKQQSSQNGNNNSYRTNSAFSPNKRKDNAANSFSSQNNQQKIDTKEGFGFETKRSNFGYRRSKGNGHQFNQKSQSDQPKFGQNKFHSQRPASLRVSKASLRVSKASLRVKTLKVKDPMMFVNKVKEVVSEEQIIHHKSFDEFALPDILKENIKRKGYTTPTPIQDQSIEHILGGKDLIGLANTGTGKTAAFLLPIINTIFRDRNKKALIIAPTRELATQIHDEFRSFTRDIKIYSSLIIGGANMGRQIYEMRRNPHVVVATPGRLKDLVQQKVAFLEDYDVVVLDEVDLMVDIGFIQDVKYFISLMPQKRQSLFFSATITPKVMTILDEFVTDPVTVSVKVQETAASIEQDIVKVKSQAEKIEQLHELLIQEDFKKVLIFGRTKHGVDKLYKDLTFRGFSVGAIHGNKSQNQRQRVLDGFKRNQIQILLATDVASRGLDIPQVSHVINYELPESYADYTHRIGRTGRANNKGTALTFID